jgi:hypothetical protein
MSLLMFCMDIFSTRPCHYESIEHGSWLSYSIGTAPIIYVRQGCEGTTLKQPFSWRKHDCILRDSSTKSTTMSYLIALTPSKSMHRAHHISTTSSCKNKPPIPLLHEPSTTAMHPRPTAPSTTSADRSRTFSLISRLT